MTKFEDNQSPYITFLESAAPGTPASTLGKLYVKTDGILYFKNDAGTETSLIAGASGIPATIFDAKGDLIAASAADTAARLAVGATNGMALVVASGEATGLKYLYQTPLMKVTRVSRQGAISTTSTTFAIIDNTKLPAVSVASCAIGDVIEVTLTGGIDASTGVYAWFDWQVVQPTLGTVRISTVPNESGSGLARVENAVRSGFSVEGYWVCAEAGTHTFQPMWRTNTGTLNLQNAVSGNDDILIQHIVKRWPVANVF